MVERFRRFLPRTEPWHSFGRAALAALILALVGFAGAPWWLVFLAAAALLTLVFLAAPPRSGAAVLGFAVVFGVLLPLPVVSGFNTLALLVWAVASAAAVGAVSAIARLVVRHTSLTAGLLETVFTMEVVVIAALLTSSVGVSANLIQILAVRLGTVGIIAAVYYERFRHRSPRLTRHHAILAAGVLALLSFQTILIAGLLPLTVLGQALFTTLVVVLAREAISLAALGEITRTTVLKGVLAGVLGTLLLFSTVPWSI
ncbi:MAG: hypothetical protein Q7S84_01435 [bacterium]|nr:hypothetical protein [bacterium]